MNSLATFKVLGVVVHNIRKETYKLILIEDGGVKQRSFFIIVTLLEARLISAVLEKGALVEASGWYPSIYISLLEILKQANLELVQVLVHNFTEQKLKIKLCLENSFSLNKIVECEVKLVDAIVLALLYKLPMHIDNLVFDAVDNAIKTGRYLGAEAEEGVTTHISDYENNFGAPELDMLKQVFSKIVFHDASKALAASKLHKPAHLKRQLLQLKTNLERTKGTSVELAFEPYSNKNLGFFLDEAVKREWYELASLLRDELVRRKNHKNKQA